MSSALIRADWVGRVVDGKFALLKWLGPSEAGGVFLAEVEDLPRKQADVELIPADADDAEAHIAAWALVAPLSHPHLIRLIDSGRCTIDTIFLIYAATEHPDEMLSEILPQRPLTATEAGEAFAPIVDALAYLHGKGIVHGHVKPGNILVVEDKVKLSSRDLYVSGQSVDRTLARQIYNAPETSSEAISPAADIWSLGVTLVEALTQYPLWERSIEGDPIVPAAIPEPFHTIVRECLRTDPARRCTLSEIKAWLQPAVPVSVVDEPVVEQPVVAEAILTTPIPDEPMRAPAKAVAEVPVAIAIPAKRRRPAIVAVVFFLIVLFVTLILHFHHEKTTSPSSSQLATPASPAPQPETRIASPPSANPAPPPSAPVPATQSSIPGATAGTVVERAMPDLLPSAVQTIRGQVDVTVRVSVDPSGNVESASFDSAGPSRYFSKMALQSAQNWKFDPAQVDGKAVSSAWTLHFTFTQAGTDVTPVEVSP
jgi:serine/threonine-protein kinase